MTSKQQQEFDAANQRCQELMTQEYWERKGREDTQYNSTGFLTLMRIGKIKPQWWSPLRGGGALGEPDLSIDGHVEFIMLPLLPTLVKTGTIDARARGWYGDIPQQTALRVRKVTRKQAKGTVPAWFAHDNNMVVPFTVTAAPKLCFHEPLKYFEDLVPSTSDRFEKGIQLVLDFVRNTQAMFDAPIN